MNKRPTNLPVIVVTGASGTIGKHFVKSFCDNYYIYAIARRSQRDAGIPGHKNIKWLRLDIGLRASVKKTMDEIAAQGGADFVLHLAGFYDFGNQKNAEYQRTNINGTQYLLENIAKLHIKRFIFASSLTVTEFTKKPIIINEESPPDATFPYAVSKRICEEMIKEYSEQFPCAVLRLAAIFSDWCEYGPLYMFLKTWFAGRWNSRIIAGNGKTSVPYLHVKNLNSIIHALMANTDHLPRYKIYIASPDGSSSHRQLFDLAVRYNFHKQIKPVHFPKWLASVGVVLLDVLGRLIGKRPFERPWMIKYINHQLNVDASETRKLLSWKPISRFHVQRRLLFLVENMKSNPYEWKRRNYEALHKVSAQRPNLRILESMILLEDEIISGIRDLLTDPDNAVSYRTYKHLPPKQLRQRIQYIYDILKQAVRSGNRLHSLSYAKNLAIARIEENFEVREVIKAIEAVGNYIVDILIRYPPLRGLEQRIHDEIILTTRLIADEVADTYERLTGFPALES